AIVQETANVSLYPDGAAIALTAALSAKYGVNPDQIILGNGSDEIILMLSRAFLVPGDETVMADNTFPIYKHNAQVENAVVVEVPVKDGKHDLDGMLAAITGRTKIVWICNPNNPTGTIVGAEELERFLAKVPPTVLVALDEAYCEYVEDV